MKVHRPEIVNLVCLEYGLTDRQIVDEKARSGPAAEARNVAAYLMHEMGFSEPRIGITLERERTAIGKGLRLLRERLVQDNDLAVRTARLLEILKTRAATPYDPKMVLVPGTVVDELKRRFEARKAEEERRAKQRELVRKFRREGFFTRAIIRWVDLPKDEVLQIIGAML